MSGVFRRLAHDRRGATAIVVALLIPVLMGAVGLAVDANLLFLESHRLQIAADSAAYTAALMLSNTTAQSNSPASFTTIATNAVAGVTAGTLIGTPVTTAVTAIGSNFSTITVTVSSQQASIFSAVLGLSSFSMQATAQAGVSTTPACIIALASTTAAAISVNNAGSITATTCGVFSDSNSSSSIYLNNGTVTATSIGVVGSTSSTQGTFSPAPLTNQTAIPDPDTAITFPAPGTCTLYNATILLLYTPLTVACGNTTVNGLMTLTGGIYYIVNGSLTFNYVTMSLLSQPSTFVFVGSSPGSLIVTNGSNATIPAFSSALVYQACPTANGYSNPDTVVNGGSTLTISGAIYLPCGKLNLNNNAQVRTISGSTSSVVANTISVVGSAGLAITGGGSGAASSQVTLLQ